MTHGSLDFEGCFGNPLVTQSNPLEPLVNVMNMIHLSCVRVTYDEAVETALTTDGYSQFGSDINTLAAIEKLSRDIKSLEEPRPLSDTSHIKYYTAPPPPPPTPEAVDAA